MLFIIFSFFTDKRIKFISSIFGTFYIFIFIKKTIPIFIIFIVYFFLLFFLAVKTNFQNLNSFTEYQYSFSPVIFLRNYIRFFYIYFDIKNLNWIFLSYDKTLTIFFLISLSPVPSVKSYN